MAKNVVLFSSPGCRGCAKVKEFLSQKNVAYSERDITKDEPARKELSAMGFKASPVTVIDGNAVAGFDPAKLETLLS